MAKNKDGLGCLRRSCSYFYIVRRAEYHSRLNYMQWPWFRNTNSCKHRNDITSMTSETSISILTQILEWFTLATVESQSALAPICSLAPSTCSLAPSISRKYSRKLLKHLVTSGKLTIGYSQAFLKALCFSDQEMLRFLNLLCNYKITKSQTIYFLVSIYTVPGRRKIPKNQTSITQILNRSQMTRAM